MNTKCRLVTVAGYLKLRSPDPRSFMRSCVHTNDRTKLHVQVCVAKPRGCKIAQIARKMNVATSTAATWPTSSSMAELPSAMSRNGNGDHAAKTGPSSDSQDASLQYYAPWDRTLSRVTIRARSFQKQTNASLYLQSLTAWARASMKTSRTRTRTRTDMSDNSSDPYADRAVGCRSFLT